MAEHGLLVIAYTVVVGDEICTAVWRPLLSFQLVNSRHLYSSPSQSVSSTSRSSLLGHDPSEPSQFNLRRHNGYRSHCRSSGRPRVSPRMRQIEFPVVRWRHYRMAGDVYTFTTLLLVVSSSEELYWSHFMTFVQHLPQNF